MKRRRTALLFFGILSMAGTDLGFSQQQNPLDAFKDAFKKALHPPGAPGTPEVPATPAATRAAPVAREVAPQASAEPFSIDEQKPTAAPVLLGDYKALPDIVGIHLGMPLREALSTLQGQYKSVQLGVPQAYPGIEQPALLEFSMGWNIPGVTNETIVVETTPPPEKQVVWRVYRRLGDPNHQMLRTEVIAELRHKYGKETIAIVPNSNDEAKTEDDKGEFWWLFDERGRPAAMPATGIPLVRNCAEFFGRGDIERSQVIFRINQTNDDQRVQQQDYCTSSVVIVRARVGVQRLVYGLTVDILEVPLAARAARSTIAMLRAAARQQQEDEIQRAAKNKPKL